MAARLVLGLSDRAGWGLKPIDIGCCAPKEENTSQTDHGGHGHKSTEERAAEFAADHKLSDEATAALASMVKAVEHNAGGHHGGEPPSMALFGRTETRQQWGEATPELHPDVIALFLDLIYVGVAFSLGSMMKNAFYSCAPGGYDGSGSGSGYADGSGSSGGSGSAAGGSA